MKYLLKPFLAILITAACITACEKVGDLPVANNGTPVVLISSATDVAPAPADSLKTVLTLNWTSPNYATAATNYKYIIEIDSTGRNFSKEYTRVLTNIANPNLSTAFTGKELNAILLGYGFSFGVAYTMDVRITSSYANNNEKLVSNVLKVKMTPYKIPPKVALPGAGRLFIVGDATDFGWTNDAAPPFPAVREFTHIEETKWAGIFNLKNSGAYKYLQTQGDWSTQFHMVSGDASAGTFEQKDSDPGFTSPATAAPYLVTVDFQTGKYTTQKQDNALGADLYITGDGTPSDWTNTPPVSQKFTQKTNGVFEITMAFVPGKAYKFLSSSGNWQPQFGGSSATGGSFSGNYGGGNDPAAVPTPDVAGNYKIVVNFISKTYTVTKQ